jgi:hypothetical protein
MMGWGTVSWAQAFIVDKTGFFIRRALVGLFEGDFIAGTILFASYFYKSSELSVRLVAFWSTLNVARVSSSLLAAGILKLRGVRGRPGWCESVSAATWRRSPSQSGSFSSRAS